MRAILAVFLIIFPLIAFAESGKAYGVFEKVTIPELSGSVIKAKLDTGAVTTSLGADKIELLKKNDSDWVRFTPQIEGASVMERPLVRHSNIKLRVSESEESTRSQRPVIMLNICFDGKLYPAEVNLADRGRFNYPLLVGRNTLIDFGAVIDPSLKYQAEAGCVK